MSTTFLLQLWEQHITFIIHRQTYFSNIPNDNQCVQLLTYLNRCRQLSPFNSHPYISQICTHLNPILVTLIFHRFYAFNIFQTPATTVTKSMMKTVPLFLFASFKNMMRSLSTLKSLWFDAISSLGLR